MRNLNNELKNKTINYNKLLKYGFYKEKDNYVLKSKIFNNQFEMIVVINKNNQISKLIDTENDEEYVLVDIQDSTGEFVGTVRLEYENKIKDIIKNCTDLNVFKSNQAIDIINYIKEKYNDNLEFLWEKFDDNAIWRNKLNNKWYGLLLTISERKLDIDSDKIIEIIDLRYQKEKIDELIDFKTIYPGYHMNKKSWITIKLDDTISTEEIYRLIDNSYSLSTDFIKELSKKTGYEEEMCEKINEIVEETFIFGENNKEKMIAKFIEKLGVDESKANEIYEAVSSTIGGGIIEKNKTSI